MCVCVRHYSLNVPCRLCLHSNTRFTLSNKIVYVQQFTIFATYIIDIFTRNVFSSVNLFFHHI